MKTVRILLLLFLPVLQTLVLKIGLAFPSHYLAIAFGGVILLDALLTLFFKKNIQRMKIVWYALPALLLYCSAASSLFIVEESYLRNTIIASNALFQWLYLINLYFLLYKQEQYQVRSYWHITMVLHVISFLNLSILLFGLIYYVEYKLSFLIIPFAIVTALFFVQQLVIHECDIRQFWRFTAVQTLIIVESAFAIHWFPTHFIPKAFFLTIPFFLINQIGYSTLKREQTVRSVLSSVAITLAMLLLVLLTSRWR
ncbi:MAG: hypothetical protein AAB400_03075 [Patescibacteria group bacterium]